MASRESSVHKCEKPKVSVCPALSSIAALMVFTSGFTRFAPASKSSVPGTSPLAPTAWNWGTKRSAGEESTEVKRYSKVFPFRKCQQLSRPRDTADTDTPSEWVAKRKRKVRADETWWNNPSFRWYIAAIAYVILSPSCQICVSHPGCPLLDVNRPLHAFKVIRATLVACAYHPPSSPGSLSINSWQFQRIWCILQLFKYPNLLKV